MNEVWIASDWHLAPTSPAAHGRLALAFLEEANAAGARVILNGDVFEELFSGVGRGEAAHPGVVAAMAELSLRGRLARTRGNHDPSSGEERIVLDWPGLGRVLVMHGHSADPVNSSALGRFGDGISRRFGRYRLVRGAASLVETAANSLARPQLVAAFRRRCLSLVLREGFELGVFGHVHEAHLRAGDRYANAGSLREDRLEWLALGQDGARLESAP